MKNKSKNIKYGQVILSKDKYFKNGKDTKKQEWQ